MSFNPTLVRLRLASPPMLTPLLGLFQSHAGSIEALAGAAARSGGPGGGGFNPTLVRLRLWVVVNYDTVRVSFNPTLVRLRRDSGPAGLILGLFQFQSHAGSIEALLFAQVEGLAAEVSIPRWFD